MDAQHIRHLRSLGDAVAKDSHDPIQLSADEIEAEVRAAVAAGRVPPKDVLAVVREETAVLLTLPTSRETREDILQAYRCGAPARIRRTVRMRGLQRTGVTHQRRYHRDEPPRVDEVSYTRIPARLLSRAGKGPGPV